MRFTHFKGEKENIPMDYYIDYLCPNDIGLDWVEEGIDQINEAYQEAVRTDLPQIVDGDQEWIAVVYPTGRLQWCLVHKTFEMTK